MQQACVPHLLDAGELAVVWQKGCAMKLETILNAYSIASTRLTLKLYSGFYLEEWIAWKLERQKQAFRARILRMDAEKDKEIKWLTRTSREQIEVLERTIIHQRGVDAEKDARIKELEKGLDWANNIIEQLTEGKKCLAYLSQ